MRAELLSKRGAVLNVVVADEAFLDAHHHGRWRPAGGDTLETRKAELRIAVRAQRKVVEASGTTVDGIPVDTSERSQAAVGRALALFERDTERTAIDFEAQPSQWLTLDKAGLTAIDVAIGRHVQAARSHARTLTEAIDAVQDESALTAIDIMAGWPGDA